MFRMRLCVCRVILGHLPLSKGARGSALFARTQFTPPTQLPCFFAAEMQKIEEAVGALDVVEDVTNVGAGREKGVDGCDEFALIGKGTLASFGVDAAARSPRADSRDIAAAFAIAVENAQKMHQVSTSRSGIVPLPNRTHRQSERGAGFGPRGQEQCGCSAARGCRAGWRRGRRQSSPGTPTADSTERKWAGNKACTNARIRRGAFREGIAQGRMDRGC